MSTRQLFQHAFGKISKVSVPGDDATDEQRTIFQLSLMPRKARRNYARQAAREERDKRAANESSSS